MARTFSNCRAKKLWGSWGEKDGGGGGSDCEKSFRVSKLRGGRERENREGRSRGDRRKWQDRMAAIVGKEKSVLNDVESGQGNKLASTRGPESKACWWGVGKVR